MIMRILLLKRGLLLSAMLHIMCNLFAYDFDEIILLSGSNDFYYDELSTNNGVSEIKISGVKENVTDLVFPESVRIVHKYGYYPSMWSPKNSQQASTKQGIKAAVTLKAVRPPGPGVTYLDTLNCNVVGISSRAFQSKTNIKKALLPNHIKELGYRAFAGCTSLEEVSIGSKITTIPKEAFYGCASLKKISFSKGDEKVTFEIDAFYGCTALEKVIVEKAEQWFNYFFQTEKSNPLFYAHSLYEGDVPKSIEHLKIPNDITIIYANAFNGAKCLKEITMSSSNDLKTIGMGAFKDCTNLQKVFIPNIQYWCDIDFKDADANPLYYAEHLWDPYTNLEITKLRIPNSVDTIPKYAFYRAIHLRRIEISENVKSIGQYAFLGCIPERIYSRIIVPFVIPSNSFDTEAYKYSKLIVPNSGNSKELYQNTSAWNKFATIYQTGEYIFEFDDEDNITFADPAVKAICVANWDTNGDGELSEDEAAAVTSLNEAFSNNREITSFDELRYFTGLTAVSDMDFFFCTSLVSMTLPKNLADVPETTFTGCESLTNLKAAEGNEYYCTVDGLLYDKNVTLLLFCPPKKAGTVVVPATVKRIGTNGFYECAELTAITLPDKLEELGDAVFVGCMKLTNIHIPASVKIMGLGLVSACTNLESITVDEANAYFQSIDGVLYTKSDLILMSYPNKKGKEYVVQDGTKGIDAYSFCYTEIEKVTLPASIKVIGYLAFGYCKNLKTIVSLNPAPTAAGIRPDIMNDDEYEGITLMVPYGSKSLYEASNGWNMFTNIVEMPDANAITITADNLTMKYGDAVPELTYKVQGGVLEGTPVLSCEATSTSPVGTYDIIVSKGTVKNENVTYVAGKLTINQAPLTISAGTYTKKQYDPMPEIVLTYNGFKNEETATVLTKQVVISCAANEESVPGEYAITLSGAEATNYDISYEAGKLIVTEPDSFTLAYIVDGELYRSFIVKYKEAITPLEEPTKEGYTFSGWSEIPETMPAHDVTVTGTFTQKTGIEQIMSDENGKAMIYTIDGRRVDNPKKGMNVIRMKDGTTRKVVVK